jgi:type I restriction enzyme S subunit
MENILTSTFIKLSKKKPHRTFQEVCDVVRGGSPRPAGSPIYYNGSIPFLKVADITKNDFKYLKTYTTTIKEAGLSKTRYVAAHTLMLTNSGATLGVPKICAFATTFNDGIQAFLNIPDDISKEYLYYFFRSKTRWFRDWVARGQGQPNLNTDMVKQMEFPLLPLSEQQQIVSYLDNLQSKIDELKRLQSETQKELDALMPSILDKAFKGEL